MCLSEQLIHDESVGIVGFIGAAELESVIAGGGEQGNFAGLKDEFCLPDSNLQLSEHPILEDACLCKLSFVVTSTQIGYILNDIINVIICPPTASRNNLKDSIKEVFWYSVTS